MKHLTRLSFTLLMLIIPLATMAQTGQGQIKFRSRRVILRENMEYRRQIDSLEKAIHEYQEHIRIEDSLKNAILLWHQIITQVRLRYFSIEAACGKCGV